jgi:hypothetical protein
VKFELFWLPKPIAELFELIFTDVEGETGLKADFGTVEEDLEELICSTLRASSLVPSLPTAAL